MAIDRGDWHFEDAKTWERACRHIALFLSWAAQRGLASAEVDAKAIAKGPTAYFIKQCDTKLWNDDLNDEGNRFVRTEYNPYLAEVHAYAAKHELDDYEIPESKATEKHFFAWLDDSLASWRARQKKKSAAKKAPAKKPAAKKAPPKKKTAAKKPAAKKAPPKKKTAAKKR